MMKLNPFGTIRPLLSVAAVAFLFCGPVLAEAEEGTAAAEAVKVEPEEGAPKKAAVNEEGLSLPGLKVRLKERCVDVDAKVCLDVGMLELIVCSEGTKEHESIFVVEAKAAHIHAALLLLGAKPGHPAMRKPINEEKTRWVDLPPRGGEIEVSVLVKKNGEKEVEHPISKFLIRAEDEYGAPEPEEGEKVDRSFPTNTFLFAGSHVYQQGEQKPRYLADESGNVISLATFGDELLCLPGVHAHANGGLVWEIDSTHLPAVDSKVTLRLRPKNVEAPPKQAPKPEKDSVGDDN